MDEEAVSEDVHLFISVAEQVQSPERNDPKAH